MNNLSHFLRAAISGLLLGCLIISVATLNVQGAEYVDRLSIDEITESLSRTYQEINTQWEIMQIFNKAEKEPEFRKNLLDSMKRRYEIETINIRCSNLTRSFRHLNASEMLPEMMKKWNEIEKKVTSLEFADLRIQLLIAITRFLPESESVEFLIKTESDKDEAPIVRFRATILLCATGNKKAIEYVLSTYENAKKEFHRNLHGEYIPPVTTSESDNKGEAMSDYLEDGIVREYVRSASEQAQKEIPITPKIDYTSRLRVTEADRDGDWLSDYLENGLLLDPNNPDTDGDGLIDGDDRNPLTKPQTGKLSEEQKIAQFILYLHSRYYSIIRIKFNFNIFTIFKYDNYDGTERPGLFTDGEFTGIDGVILAMTMEQFKKLRSIHGDTIRPIALHEYPEVDGIKKFHLSESDRWFDVTFKKFNDTWLPIYWELVGMS